MVVPSPSPTLVADALPAAHRRRIAEAADALPHRALQLLEHGGHRAQGRVIRDVVLLLGVARTLHTAPSEALLAAAVQAGRRLEGLQLPAGTFSGGDNLESPPDSAFTVNDLAWARVAADGFAADASRVDGSGAGGPAGHGDGAQVLAPLLPLLDRVLEAATPALIGGGVHTPNHRWEIASALARLWQAQGADAARERALQWLAEGADLQADGMFSERSANYAAHVSVPSLLALGRILEREDLLAAADRGLHRQAALTDAEGLVETLASRRQDQVERFDGGALHPWFRAHAARTGDPLTARAAQRTSARADADALLTLLAQATEDPSVLAPLPVAAAEPAPEHPEVVVLEDSGLVRVDHGSSAALLFGGTDTHALGRIASGVSSQPVLARFLGRSLGVRDLRLSRDFFSLGPLRPGPPRSLPAEGERPDEGEVPVGAPLRFALEDEVRAEYFHPLAAADRSPEGRYDLEFNGRFAAAMSFSRRPADLLTLRTSMQAAISPDQLELRWEFEGPASRLCLLLALDGLVPGGASHGTSPDDQGRRVLLPEAGASGTASCTLHGDHERLEVTAHGALGGSAFYDPGEAFTVLGATDEPGGDVLLIPASSTEPLSLMLRLAPVARA